MFLCSPVQDEFLSWCFLGRRGGAGRFPSEGSPTVGLYPSPAAWGGDLHRMRAPSHG